MVIAFAELKMLEGYPHNAFRKPNPETCVAACDRAFLREVKNFYVYREVLINASKSNIGLQRVQAEKLRLNKEQEEQS